MTDSSAKLTRRAHTPEELKRMSEGMVRFWSDPANHVRQAALIRAGIPPGRLRGTHRVTGRGKAQRCSCGYVPHGGKLGSRMHRHRYDARKAGGTLL